MCDSDASTKSSSNCKSKLKRSPYLSAMMTTMSSDANHSPTAMLSLIGPAAKTTVQSTPCRKEDYPSSIPSIKSVLRRSSTTGDVQSRGSLQVTFSKSTKDSNNNTSIHSNCNSNSSSSHDSFGKCHSALTLPYFYTHCGTSNQSHGRALLEKVGMGSMIVNSTTSDSPKENHFTSDKSMSSTTSISTTKLNLSFPEMLDEGDGRENDWNSRWRNELWKEFSINFGDDIMINPNNRKEEAVGLSSNALTRSQKNLIGSHRASISAKDLMVLRSAASRRKTGPFPSHYSANFTKMPRKDILIPRESTNEVSEISTQQYYSARITDCGIIDSNDKKISQAPSSLPRKTLSAGFAYGSATFQMDPNNSRLSRFDRTSNGNNNGLETPHWMISNASSYGSGSVSGVDIGMKNEQWDR